MSMHTKHSAGDCEVCAAQQDADAVGAIPTAGHSGNEHVERLASKLAFLIYHHDSDLVSQDNIRRALIEFAEEIKRQAVEP